MEELVGYSPWDRKESYMTEQLHSHDFTQPPFGGFPAGLVVKSLPAVQDAQETGA